MTENLFIDTHAELHELNAALEQLQEEYRFDIDYEDITDENENYEEDVLPNNDDAVQFIFTNIQICEFQKIYNKHSMMKKVKYLKLNNLMKN